jgi:hypothetical protein
MGPDGCSTPCNDDCDAVCHERHYFPWLGDHSPDRCEKDQRGQTGRKSSDTAVPREASGT